MEQQSKETQVSTLPKPATSIQTESSITIERNQPNVRSFFHHRLVIFLRSLSRPWVMSLRSLGQNLPGLKMNSQRSILKSVVSILHHRIQFHSFKLQLLHRRWIHHGNAHFVLKKILQPLLSVLYAMQRIPMSSIRS